MQTHQKTKKAPIQRCLLNYIIWFSIQLYKAGSPICWWIELAVRASMPNA